MTSDMHVTESEQPSPSEVLAVVVEDHFRTLLGLSEDDRDRLRDAGAGVILAKFETRLADTAGGLGGLVGQQARQVEEWREQLFGWLDELDEAARSADTGSDTDGRGSGYGNAGSDPSITTETGEANDT